MASHKLPAKKKYSCRKETWLSNHSLRLSRRTKKCFKRKKKSSLKVVNESLKSLDIYPLKEVEKGTCIEACQTLEELKNQIPQTQSGMPKEPKSKGALIRIQKLQRRNWLKKSDLSKNSRSKGRCVQGKKEWRNVIRNLRKQEEEWDAKCQDELRIFDESQQAYSQRIAIDELLAESDWSQLNRDFSKWNAL